AGAFSGHGLPFYLGVYVHCGNERHSICNSTRDDRHSAPCASHFEARSPVKTKALEVGRDLAAAADVAAAIEVAVNGIRPELVSKRHNLKRDTGEVDNADFQHRVFIHLNTFAAVDVLDARLDRALEFTSYQVVGVRCGVAGVLDREA